jgi:hypothetical protein
MDVQAVIEELRDNAIAVCAGFIARDGSTSAFAGPPERREPIVRHVAHLASLDMRDAFGSPSRRWLLEAGEETLAVQGLVDGRTMFVVIDARSTPGLARVRLMQSARRFEALENP